MDCIFCKISSHEIPSTPVYEDDLLIAFLDIHPVNKGHTLVVPKNHSADFLTTDTDMLSRLMEPLKLISSAVMKGVGADACNISTNNGAAAGQVIFHLHWHIVPRFSDDGLKLWKGNAYQDGEMEEIAKNIQKHIAS
ncbi:MAG: HIT family protein [Patescibacteria group bacterium]